MKEDIILTDPIKPTHTNISHYGLASQGKSLDIKALLIINMGDLYDFINVAMKLFNIKFVTGCHIC